MAGGRPCPLRVRLLTGAIRNGGPPWRRLVVLYVSFPRPCPATAGREDEAAATVVGCRAGFPACRFGGLSSPPKCPGVPVPWCVRTVLGTDSPKNRQARKSDGRMRRRQRSSGVGQAFQPAGSADFPVRRNARMFRCRGVSAPSWGLTVPGTGRLDSLPYKGWRRRAVLGTDSPRNRQARKSDERMRRRQRSSGVGQAFQPAGSADFPVRRNARMFRCRGLSAPSSGLTVPRTGRLDSLPYKGWRRRAVLGTDSPRNRQARQPALQGRSPGITTG